MPEEQPKYPEQQNMVNRKPSHKRRRWVIIVIAIIVVLLVVVAIIGHSLIHKGTVTSFSATSITIKPSGGGSTETFTITSSTKDQGGSGKSPTAYSIKDIHEGEVVTVATDGLHSRKAAVILSD